MSNSNLTVQSIIDLNSSRDAQRILREYIVHETRHFEDEWAYIVATAKKSMLVNHDHAHSRSMRSVSKSQILDRMNVTGLEVLIDDMNEHDYDQALKLLSQAFNNDIDVVCNWPYARFVPNDKDVYVSIDNMTSDDTDDEAEAEPEAEASGAYTLDAKMVPSINVLLNRATDGEVDDLQALLDEVIALRNQPKVQAKPQVQATGSIPDGQPKALNAQQVFGINDPKLDFLITCYEWDGDNPLVPIVDEDYVFDVDGLADALWAIENNCNAWFSGHTGTGKSTKAAQICARTKRMMVRVNMDSGIERPDFIGTTEVTHDDDGVQVTSFKDGILPKAMQAPCLLVLDECDAVRPDIAYVLQPVLEGEPLRLLEDGGRMVYPHPDFHILATGNSVGSGDSSGLYASAVKVQSRALINRFSVFVDVDYMPVDKEMQLARAKSPTVSDEAVNLVKEFVTHYRTGFLQGTIATPISPRNTKTIMAYVDHFEKRISTIDAVHKALKMNVMRNIDEGDVIAVTGIMDRLTEEQPF